MNDIDRSAKYSKLNSDKNDKNLVREDVIKHKKQFPITSLLWVLFLIVTFFAIGIPIAITLPLILKKENNSSLTHDTNEAILILNSANNHDTRINLWNEYMAYLSKPITPTGNDSILNKIIREDIFIDQFIDFLTTNLLIDNSQSPEVGSLTQLNLEKIKTELSTASSKSVFKNSNLGIYTNLFSFSPSSSTAMFSFNNGTLPLISFSWFMPWTKNGLDLIYRKDKSVAIKIDNTSSNASNKIRLTINNFTDPYIASPISYYFKSVSSIEFPPIILNEFSNFFESKVNMEIINRQKLIDGFNQIKRSIDLATTPQEGLSYWNDFTTKYGASNKILVEKDLAKPTNAGNLYTFITRTTPPNNNYGVRLNQIRELASDPNNLSVNNIPYNNNSTQLINTTTTTTGERFTIQINIVSFRYEFSVINLFYGEDNAIQLTPYIKISGILRVLEPGVTRIYPFAPNVVEWNVQDVVNITYLNGLKGFFYNLIMNQ